MHIAEKLASFDRRTRQIAEKGINDIIFELEMGDHSQSPAFPRHTGNSMQYSSSDCSQGFYMGMLQSQAPQYHNFSDIELLHYISKVPVAVYPSYSVILTKLNIFERELGNI